MSSQTSAVFVHRRRTGMIGSTILLIAMVGAMVFHRTSTTATRAALAPEATAAVCTGLQDRAFARPIGQRTLLPVHASAHADVTRLTVALTPLSYTFTPHTNRFELTRPRGDALEAFTVVWRALEPNELYASTDQVKVALGIGGLQHAATVSVTDLAAFGQNHLTHSQFYDRWLIERT